MGNSIQELAEPVHLPLSKIRSHASSTKTFLAMLPRSIGIQIAGTKNDSFELNLTLLHFFELLAEEIDE